jgi:hypothetical protein
MSIDAQKHVGLQVEPAQVRQLNEYLQVPGTVQATDTRVNIVRALARGRLHDVMVRVGDRVRTGQPPLRLRDPLLNELATDPISLLEYDAFILESGKERDDTSGTETTAAESESDEPPDRGDDR